MARKTTKFPAGVDTPIVQDANFRYDPNTLAYQDDQIRAVQSYVLNTPSGVNAFTPTLAPFVMPVVSGSVTANVGTTSWMGVGQTLYIENAGTMTVSAIVDATHVTLTNPGTTGNASSSTVIASGSKVSPSGVPGASGGGGSGLAYTLDGSSAALAAGDVYCAVPGTTTITKATASAIAAVGNLAISATTSSASPGALVSYTDVIPSSASGLGFNTTTTASFTMPAVGSNVTASLASTSGMVAGDYLTVGSSEMKVISVTNSTTLVLTNTGKTGNVSPTTSVASGSVVTGIRAKVAVNALGRMYRVYRPCGAERIIGNCDATGGVTVAPQATTLTSPVHAINPVTFGAIPDLSDATTAANNTAAFQAAIDAICTVDSLRGYTILVDGVFYLDGELKLRRPITLRGVGGSQGRRGAQLNWTKATRMIRALYPGNDTSSFSALSDSCIIEDLDITGVYDNTNWEYWAPDIQLTAGNYYRLPAYLADGGLGNSTWWFKCTTSGWTSDTAPPANMATPVLFADGALGFSGLVETLSSTQIAAGKTAATYFADVRSGILSCTKIFIKRCNITYAGGDGITLYGVSSGATYRPEDGALTGSNVNNSQISDCIISLCGGGIGIYGSDGNACLITGVNVLGAGSGNDLGVGFNDHSQSGCTWVACYTDTGTGGGFISNPGSHPVFLGCGSENAQGNNLRGLPTIYGGKIFSGEINANGNATFTYNGAGEGDHNVGARTTGGGAYTGVSLKLDKSGQDFLSWQPDSEVTASSTTHYYGFRLYDTNGVSYLQGSAGYGYRSTATVVVDWDVQRYTLARHALGPGFLIDPIGQYHGYATFYWEGWDLRFQTTKAKQLRGGKRNVGDAWWTNPAPNPGTFRKSVCVTAGTEGSVYAVTTYTAGQSAPDYIPGDIVTESGIAAKCITGGTTTSSPLGLSGTTATVANPARTWRSAHTYSLSSKVRATDTTATHSYSLVRPAAYPLNTNYAANAIFEAPGQTDECFLAYIPSWSVRYSNRTITIGSLCAGTDGNTYVAVDKIVSGVRQGAKWGATTGTGTTEPVWAAGTTPIFDGTGSTGTLWMQVQLKTGSSYPSFNEATKDYSMNPANGQGTCLDTGSCSIIGGYVGGTKVLTAGQKIDAPVKLVHFRFVSSGTEPTWPTTGGTVTEAPTAKPGDYGYGVVWQDLGATEFAGALTTNGTAKFMRIDTTPVYAVTEKVVMQGTGSVTLGATATASASSTTWNYQMVKNLGTVNCALTFSNLWDGWSVRIMNPGAGVITVSNAGGAVIGAGKNAELYSDGANVYLFSTT